MRKNITEEFRKAVEKRKHVMEQQQTSNEHQSNQLRNRKGSNRDNSTTESITKGRTALGQRLTRDAREILKNIETINQLLVENRKGYLDLRRHFSSAKSTASTSNNNSSDKDFMDEQTNQFLANCMGSIGLLEKEIKLAKFSSVQQQQQHWDCVIWFLRMQLAGVSRLQKEQQEMRVKFLLETHAISTNSSSSAMTSGRGTNRWSRLAMKQQLLDNDDTARQADLELDQLPHHEQLQIQKENTALMDELNGMEAELEQVERNLYGISDLQAQLEMHLSAQTQDIDRLYGEAQQTTDTVLRGNGILYKVAREGIAYRSYMVMFFLVMSLVLLFLHWYD